MELQINRYSVCAWVKPAEQIERFCEHRNDIASEYYEKLADLPLYLPARQPDRVSSFHLFTVQLKSEEPALRRLVFDELRSQGIGVNVHYIPVHLQPYYARLGYCSGDFPNAELYYSRAISIPIHCRLSASDRKRVIQSLRAAIDKHIAH